MKFGVFKIGWVWDWVRLKWVSLRICKENLRLGKLRLGKVEISKFEIGWVWDGWVWYLRDGRVVEIVEIFADYIYVLVFRVEVIGAMEGFF